MSRRLWIAGEVREWLTGLRSDDLPAARLVGEAVIALTDETPGPPLVVPVDPARWTKDPTVALDYAYQRQLMVLREVRRAAADVATSRKRLELHIAQLEAQVRKLGDQSVTAADAGRQDLAHQARERQADVAGRLSGLYREYPEMLREEENALLASRRLQHQADVWQTRKEKIKAAYATGRAWETIERALAEAGEPSGGRPTSDAVTADTRSAAETLMDATRPEGDQAETVPELQELRLGALTGHDLRILFAVETPGTVLLLAAAKGELRDETLRLAYDPRSDQGEMTVESFLSEFFPGEEAERRDGAARLTGRGRTHALEDARVRTGLTLEQVAERMDTTPERVAAIERAGDAVEVGVLAAYLAALGGRLEIVADLGRERVNLR